MSKGFRKKELAVLLRLTTAAKINKKIKITDCYYNKPQLTTNLNIMNYLDKLFPGWIELYIFWPNPLTWIATRITNIIKTVFFILQLFNLNCQIFYIITKNIPIKYSVLIKSIFLLPDYKYMNKQIKKFLRCIKHLHYRSALSSCEYSG